MAKEIEAFTMTRGNIDNVPPRYLKIDYNQRIINKVNKRKKKCCLQRIKIAGLIAVGITSLSIGFISAKATYNMNQSKGFEYNQYMGDSFATQYESYTAEKLDLDEEDILNSMATYEINNDTYNNVNNENIDDNDEARVNLVKSVPSLTKACDDIIKLKLEEAMNLSNNATITYNPQYDQADGFSCDISVNDGNNSYVIESSKLPIEIFNLLNTESNIKTFRGDGSSDAWDTGIKNYEKYTNELYYRLLNFVDNHYNYNGNKLVEVNNIDNTKTR